MQTLASTWNALDLRKRIVAGLAALAMFAAVLGLARMAGTPTMSLLYAGLDAGAAGQVVAALESRGVAYQVQGDSIRVDAARRDELRMLLAAEGLPATGGAGYELLDGLSGFGTTSQMFDAAYWRAKEGELARTILAVPGLRAARVHIAQAPAQPFQRDRRPTASVTVTTAGVGLPPAQARALRHLVAAAVPGMRPEDVAVIDSATGLVPGPEETAMPGAADTRAADLKRNVERLLAARLGPGRAVVEVSVDVETTREQLTERRLDPTGRVAISSETEERTTSSTQPGGDVTVASNLPEGDASGGGAGRSNATESRERVNYEVSETSRDVLRMPGAVRRMTVAVLIDGEVVPGPDGTPARQPRGTAEMDALRDLVASAVGLDEARGDVLTLRSLPFEVSPEAGSRAEAAGWSMLGPIDAMAALRMGLLAIVVLVLGLFVVRPVLRAARPLPAGNVAPVLALPGADPSAASVDGLRVLTGVIDDDTPLHGRDDTGQVPEADPVARLRRLIEERQAESVEILRGWMEAEEEQA